MKEIWKDIKGFENYYQVSNLGRIRSIDRWVTFIRKGKKEKRFKKGNIRRLHKLEYGYLGVDLHKNGIGYNVQIHRLEAITFGLPIPEHLKGIPIEKLQINHKDENPSNNFLWINDDGTIDSDKSNLMWCTDKENKKWGTYWERFSENRTGHKVTDETIEKLRNHKSYSKSVLQIDNETNEIIKEFPSMNEVQRQLGFRHSHISACCLGKQKTAYGYKWSFK